MSKRSLDFLSHIRRSGSTNIDTVIASREASQTSPAAPLPSFTASELEKIHSLRQAIQSDIEGSIPLQNFVSTSCLIRYLRARSWKLPDATKMLKATIEWRKSYKPELITWNDVAEEAASGKQYILPDPKDRNLKDRGSSHATDLRSRPVLIMRPRCENTKNYDVQMKLVVYHLETVSWLADLTASSGCKLCWIVDFVGYSYSNSPPLKVSMQFLHIMQSHYPERLGVAIAYRAPKLFFLLWKTLQPVMDSLTRSKVVFIEGKTENQLKPQLAKHIDLSMIDSSLSGTSNFTWNAAAYGQIRQLADQQKHRDTHEEPQKALSNGHQFNPEPLGSH